MPAKRPPSMAPSFTPNFNPATAEYDPNDPFTKGLAPGLDTPLDTGYDVTTVSHSRPGTNDWTIVMENAYGQQYSLWAEEIEMGFQLQGQTGQARHYRQFYPQAFSQATMTVRGRMPSQYEYNRLAQFVRVSHVAALDTAETSYARYEANQIDSSISLPQLTRTDSHGDALPTINLYLMPTSLGEAGIPDYFQHRGMVLEGFIPSIQAGATKFEYAPEFTFDFSIAQSQRTSDIGIFTDTLVTGSQIMTELAQNDPTALQIMSSAALRSSIDNAHIKANQPASSKLANTAFTIGKAFGSVFPR